MESSELTKNQKITVFADWMKGDHVLVHLDARAEGVSVPQHLSASPNLALKLSYLFHGETKHDETAISAYLRFNGQYQLCVIPWSAVWGLSNGEGESRVWPEDLPKELAHVAAAASATPASEAAAEAPKESHPPSLSIVGKKSGGGKKPKLRRVK